MLGQTDWKWRCLTTYLSHLVATSGSTQTQLQKSEPMDHRKFSSGSKTYGLVISAIGSTYCFSGWEIKVAGQSEQRIFELDD